ncbi:ATP-grasp domain-containing protein [Streptomyces sp. NPDC054958]
MSEQNDLHALAAQKELEQYGDVCCHIIESNRVCQGDGVSWTEGEGLRSAPLLPARGNELLDIRNVDAIWYRRVFGPQSLDFEIEDAEHRSLIEGSATAALVGILLAEFKGAWISDPFATRSAENKVYQMRVARRAGFSVPRTLVSNNPSIIRRFCAELGDQVVVKSLRQSENTILLTQKLRPEHLESDECLRLCPAIYQEYVPGPKHLRVQIFGDYISAMSITSEDLDWRPNLNVPCEVYHLNDATVSRLRRVVRDLNLRMGVVDLKLSGDVPTWLEINPQGQFLFVEGLTGLPLNEAVCRFLRQETLAAASAKI